MNEGFLKLAANDLRSVRERRPLVHNITNYVAMDFSANALLALGASPVMAHAVDEVEEMVGLAGALVLNIGTLSTHWIEAMLIAGKAASARAIPVVLDPVGAGATRLRTDTAISLIDQVRPSVVRGNASEILALGHIDGKTKGVDSTATVDQARRAAQGLARGHEAIVAVTGAIDFITDGSKFMEVANGHPLMSRVTATGCVASAIVGAFCAVEQDRLAATVAGILTLCIAGEMAAKGDPGPGSFRARLIDALHKIEPEALIDRGRVSSGELRQ